MPKALKFTLLTAGILVLILIALLVLVKVLVTPEKVRATLVPLAEQTLQRKVTLGEIDIGLLSGVALKDLRVQEKTGTDEFISIKALALHYQLLPLLTGKVVIDQVKLLQPKLVVIRNPDGSFNFSDLLAKKPASAERTGTTAPAVEKTSTSGSALNLLVNEVAITDGELQFIDRSSSSQAPFRYALSQLSLQARQITLDKSFPIKLSALFNGSRIALSGAYDLNQQQGSVTLNLASLDLIQLAPYYRDALPGKLGSGMLSLNIEADIAPRKISSKGKLVLNQVDLLLNALPDAELKQAKLKIDYALDFQRDQQQLDISKMLVDFNDSVVGGEGKVVLAGHEPDLAIVLRLDKFDLRTLVQGLPTGLTKRIQSYGLAGELTGRVELAGRPSAGAGLLQKASLQLNDVQASVANLRAGVSGAVDYADQQLQAEKLQLNFGDQQALLSVKAANLLGDRVSGNFQLSADTLDINKLLPPPTPETSQSAISGANSATIRPVDQPQKPAAEEIGPFNIPAEMQGTLAVNTLTYNQLTLDQVHADLLLKNNHLLITRLRSRIAGGELTAASDINLGVKGLAYQGQLNLSQSRLAELVSGLFPTAGQSVTGLMQCQNNFSGQGTIPKRLLKSLQVKGLLQLQQGRMAGSPLLEQFAGFLGSPELKVLSFDTLQSRYDLRNGLAKLSGQVDGSRVKLTPEGTVGIDGRLNLRLNALLAPGIMAKLGSKGVLQQVLSDKSGWGMVPIKLTGTISNPRFDLDSKALRKQAVGKAKQELEKQLLKKIVPKGGEETPVKQLLDGTLKKLFGN